MAMAAKAGSSEGSEAVSRLTEVIGRFARSRTKDGVANGVAPQMSFVERVLREIDETVLPRRIVVQSGRRVVARLLVSQRRLFAVRIEEKPGDTTGPEPGDPAQAARMFAARLQKALHGISDMRMTVARSNFEPGTDRVGCSVAGLAFAMGVRIGQARATDLEALRRVVIARADAWLHQRNDTGQPEADGDIALIAELHLMAAEATARAVQSGARRRIGANAPSCTLFPVAAGKVALSAQADADLLLAILPEAEIQPLIAAWQTGLPSC